jgi:hypothetical protein
LKSRNTLIAIAITGVLCLSSLFLIGWAVWQIYGIGGWRDEVYALSGANAAQQAMDDFRQNKLRLYILGHATDRHQFTGTNDGPFELWIPSFHPALGSAHRYSTEEFVKSYNRKMLYMHSHPEDFPRSKVMERKERE